MTASLGFIAHRGESYDAPENTLAAVKLAWQRGARAVEVDVHLTADDRFCVIHDFNTKRITGQNLIIRKSNLSELQQLDAGGWKGPQWAGEPIPSLAQVIAAVPDHGKLVIEIKPHLTEVDAFVNEINNSTLREKQVEVISFNFNTLARVKQKLPQIKMLWLLESGPHWWQYLRGRGPDAVMTRLSKHRINGINIGDSRFLNQEYIKKFTAAGFSVYVYTVNDPLRAQQLLKWGVEAVTTDRAAWLKQTITSDNPTH